VHDEHRHARLAVLVGQHELHGGVTNVSMVEPERRIDEVDLALDAVRVGEQHKPRVRRVVVHRGQLHAALQQIRCAPHSLRSALEVDVLARQRFGEHELFGAGLKQPHPERDGLAADEHDPALGDQRLQLTQDALNLFVRERRLVGHRGPASRASETR
jgi:hypothetical protein